MADEPSPGVRDDGAPLLVQQESLQESIKWINIEGLKNDNKPCVPFREAHKGVYERASRLPISTRSSESSPTGFVNCGSSGSYDPQPADESFHEPPFESDLGVDAPLAGKSCAQEPDRSSRTRFLTILNWIDIVLLLSSICILLDIGWILFLWLKPSEWRRSVILDDRVIGFVTTASTIFKIAIPIHAATSLMKFYSVSAPRTVSRFLTPSSPDIRLTLSITIFAIFFSAAVISSQHISNLLMSDLGPVQIGRPAAPYKKQYYHVGDWWDMKNHDARRKAFEEDHNRKPYGMGWHRREQLRLTEPDFSTLTPLFFPAFAEYWNSSSRDTQAGVDDTGTVVRGLLPYLDSATRENIWRYQGYGTLLDTRVICMQPKVIDASISSDGEHTWIEGHLSMGALRPSGLYHDLGRDPHNETDFTSPIPFTCYLIESRTADPPISLCAVGSITGNPRSPGRFGLQVNNQFNLGWPLAAYWRGQPGQPRPYVLAKYFGPPVGGLKNSPFSYSTTSAPTPWTDVYWKGHSTFALELSLCFPSFQAVDTWFTATSSTPRKEPSLPLEAIATPITDTDTWYCGSCYGAPAPADSQKLGCCNTCGEVRAAYASVSWRFSRGENVEQCSRELASPSLNVTPILNLLGASSPAPLSPSTRGILSLLPNPDPYPWTSGQTSALDFTFGFLNRTYGLTSAWNESKNYIPHTYALCPGCGVDDPEGRTLGGAKGAKRIDRVLATIFQQSLRMTQSPATALQTLFTLANFMQYYRRIPEFEIKGYSTLSFYEEHVGLARSEGLLALIAILWGYFVGLAVVARFFGGWKGGVELGDVGNVDPEGLEGDREAVLREPYCDEKVSC